MGKKLSEAAKNSAENLEEGKDYVMLDFGKDVPEGDVDWQKLFGTPHKVKMTKRALPTEYTDYENDQLSYGSDL